MPNWMEGNLKIKGKQKDIVKFFTEQFTDKNEGFNLELDTDELGLKQKYNAASLWFKDISRAFTDDNYVTIHYKDYWNKQKNYEEEIVAVSIRFCQAWSLKPKEFAELAKRYNLCFKILGHDQGMQITQRLEVSSNGEIIDFEEQKIESSLDWCWNVDNCNFGG